VAEGLAPQTPLDILLVDLWAEVLGRPVGIQDSLAELGATEPEIERLMARVEREMDLSVAARDWNPPGTIEALAAVLVRQGAPAGPLAGSVSSLATAGQRPRVLARNTGGERPPFIFLHGDFNGAGFYCLSLAAQLGPAQPFHALMPHGLDGEAIPSSIERMAQDHFVTLRAIQPAGPYRLGGHCNGGLIAFEMARRLKAQGERVAVLVMVASDVRSAAAQPVPVAPARSWLRLLRSYWRRLRQAAGGAPSRVGAPPMAGSRGARAIAERLRAHAERLAAYKHALLTYAPGPYGGPVVLLWPEESRSRHPGDPTQGWGAVAPALEVRAIPGGHLSCVTTYVRAVAAEIRRALDGA
jgi:thioesterase domain-containing protein